MIRVCIVDDHTLVREGLQSLLHLTDDIRVIAQASNGREALGVLKASRPDVLLLDIRMPEFNGLRLMQSLSEAGLSIPTVILTTFDDDTSFFECLKLGAQGYLLKDVTLRALTEAVRTVAVGGILINPAMTERVMRVLQGKAGAVETPVERLTDRETDILRLMTAGFSNGEIASALRIAEGTVKNHVSNILSKLDVRDRTRAVLKAIGLGLVS
jgi:DNA-binding NarL/FixJ family response regulator